MATHQRTSSFSQNSEVPQTAQDFISDQLQLEADAREALPYQFDTCTRPLGSIRQSLFSCLTCNPPPTDPSPPYNAAGLCYSCSISCHGEHQLVELFTRRNFACDCGTTRLPQSSPCSLRINASTGSKGDVHSEEPTASNTYNHNFRNRFCGCNQEYDAHNEKGTMYQCLGLATEEEGGCGEDWWHPECIMGLGRDWYLNNEAGFKKEVGHTTGLETLKEEPENEHKAEANGTNPVAGIKMESTTADPLTTEAVHTIPTITDAEDENLIDPEHPTPPGFPAEDDFEHFICYKCIDAHPWIKRYAGTNGFLPPVLASSQKTELETSEAPPTKPASPPAATSATTPEPAEVLSRKRKADDTENTNALSPTSKKPKSESQPPDLAESPSENPCIYNLLPPAPTVPLSLFLLPSFRPHLCHCPIHYPLLPAHPALLEPEYTHEPPLSTTSSSPSDDNHSLGSRSLLDRGEAALSNIDRVRAIEGVMAYNHLRDKVKGFLKPFAESGVPVGAEDVKRYFEKLRGDEEAIRRAGREGGAGGGSSGGDGVGTG